MSSPSTAVIRELLAEQRLTYVEIRERTGYGQTTVEYAIRELRETGDPAIWNFVSRWTQKKVAPRLPAAADGAHPLDPAAVVRAGMDSRTDLERAWAGESS